MRKLASLLMLSALSLVLFAPVSANAAGPTYREGCVFHGWIVSGGTLTPFDAIVQEAVQYTSATGGNVMSGQEVVNVGGSVVCTYNVVAPSTFTVNSSGVTTGSVTFAPAAGNPAGCATANFVTTSQGVITAAGNYDVQTSLGATSSGTCSFQ